MLKHGLRKVPGETWTSKSDRLLRLPVSSTMAAGRFEGQPRAISKASLKEKSEMVHRKPQTRPLSCCVLEMIAVT